MSKDSEKPNEFKRYRQALAAIYLTAIAGGFGLLAASVAKQLFLPPDVHLEGPVLSAEKPSVHLLLECNHQVQSLYDQLGAATAALLAAPQSGSGNPKADSHPDFAETSKSDAIVDIGNIPTISVISKDSDTNLGAEWEDFGQRWVHQWHVINARCRFEELGGSLGEPYDRMAQVHGDLRSMRLKYQSLLVHFDEEQADELRRMNRALESSRVALEAAAEKAGETESRSAPTPSTASGEQQE